MDESAHSEMVDLLRRVSFAEACEFFRRLVLLAHNQGKIDAYTAFIGRVANGADPAPELEENIRRAARRNANDE